MKKPHQLLKVFPVLTGMNRGVLTGVGGTPRVPRAYGDEPYGMNIENAEWKVFPVLTGMNRLMELLIYRFMSVPRAYGDEPSYI